MCERATATFSKCLTLKKKNKPKGLFFCKKFFCAICTNEHGLGRFIEEGERGRWTRGRAFLRHKPKMHGGGSQTFKASRFCCCCGWLLIFCAYCTNDPFIDHSHNRTRTLASLPPSPQPFPTTPTPTLSHSHTHHFWPIFFQIFSTFFHKLLDKCSLIVYNSIRKKER